MRRPEIMQANTVFNGARTELEMHFIQEEAADFPLIRKHARDVSASVAPFPSTAEQHRALHAKALKELEETRHLPWGGEAPAGVGPTVAATPRRLDALIADLKVHVHLENDAPMMRLQADP